MAMAGSTTEGVVQILFDFPSNTSHTSLRCHREMAKLVDRLSNLVSAQRLAATWALSDPANCCHTERILDCQLTQEIAIAADMSWLGSGVQRSAVVRELNGRVEDAQNRSLVISSITLETSQLTNHLDVLIKRKISAICTYDGCIKGKRTPNKRSGDIIKPLRYGLWNLPATLTFPAGRGILGSKVRGLKGPGSVGRACAVTTARELLWVRMIDLIQQQDTQLVVLKRLLKQIGDLQRQDALAVETISQTVARQRIQNERKRTTSILRPAA